MLFPAYYWNWPEMHILISEHRDGELITQVIKRLGFSVVRGSTTRGGARALREMSLRIDRGHLCVTPDGPRGPRRSVHQGIAYLGSRTGFPIVGAGMAFKRPWRAKSWDRFAVPRPFSPAACVVPEAVIVPPDADRDTIESCRLESRATHAGQPCSKPRRGCESADVARRSSTDCGASSFVRFAFELLLPGFCVSSKVRLPFQALALRRVRRVHVFVNGGQP